MVIPEHSPSSPVRRFTAYVLRRLTSVSIRTKILGMVVGVILLLGLGVTLLVRVQLQSELAASLEARGIAIAGDLSARSADLILTENTFSLYQLIRDTLENNPDVRYAFVLDPTGGALVHSFGQGVPPDLLSVNPVNAGAPYRVQVLDSNEGLITDVAVPILGGRAGVARVGLSQRRLAASVSKATWNLAAVTGIALTLGLGLALVLTRVLTRPVLELVSVARAVGQGDLSAKAIRYMDDEIGELASAFSSMTDDLARSRAELLRRVSELATLTATATTISANQSLPDTLQTALEKVLEVMRLRAGWIFLTGERPAAGSDSCLLTLVVQSGLSPAFAAEEAGRELGQCVCGRVLQHSQPLIVRDIRRECPRLSPQVIETEGLTCHASVPLVTRDRVVGVMNVASADSREFTPEEITLLDSVGRQIGVAIENARLWEEVKEKEVLRSQFLGKIIAAQEAERKRLARELHDEASQTLTALSLGLRTFQEAKGLSVKENQLVEYLKSLTTNLMSELHHLAVQLRPSALDRVGLVGALEQYMHELRQRFGLDIQFETEKMNGVILSPEIETSLYRILQEALTNVARHAQATRAAVLLQVRNGEVVATVEDNGVGFDPDHATQKGRLGLFGMQERVAMLNGSVNIETAEGAGTTIFIKIPLPANETQKSDILDGEDKSIFSG